MRYYVVADPHGFYKEMRTALEEAGFFKEKEPHKLIVCGDLMDRGNEALKMQEFILELMKKDEVILIRGNHEDLMLDLMDRWSEYSYRDRHHLRNGTVDTACQLTNVQNKELEYCALSVLERLYATPFIREIIPAMLDYYETEHYIFTHGWIPSAPLKDGCYDTNCSPYRADWREASADEWHDARWCNGIESAHFGFIEPGKTIVCGHWNCSFGHFYYEDSESEFDEGADFSPYYADGIIAIDGCTVLTQKVNCIVIDD